MRKKVGIIKRVFCISLIFLLSINSFAAIVSDNDGSAFITKSEFDALKSSFQAQIDSYNTSIDSKIDGAIASYLAGIRIQTEKNLDNLYPLYSISGMAKDTNGLLWSSATGDKYINVADDYYASRNVDFMRCQSFIWGNRRTAFDHSELKVVLNKEKNRIESVKTYSWIMNQVAVGLFGPTKTATEVSGGWNDSNSRTKLIRNETGVKMQGIIYNRGTAYNWDGSQTIPETGFNDILFIESRTELYTDTSEKAFITPLAGSNESCVYNDNTDTTAPTYVTGSTATPTWDDANDVWKPYATLGDHIEINPTFTSSHAIYFLRDKSYKCPWAVYKKNITSVPWVDFQSVDAANQGVGAGLVIATLDATDATVTFDVQVTEEGYIMFWLSQAADYTWGGQKTAYSSGLISLLAANTTKRFQLTGTKDDKLWCMYLPKDSTVKGAIKFIGEIVQKAD